MAKKTDIMAAARDESQPESEKSLMLLTTDEAETGAFLCNFDYRDSDNRDLLFLAEQPSDTKGSESAGREIDVQYWIATKILIPDRVSHEDVPVVRCVVISPDREVFSTLSRGVLKSLELLRRLVGSQPYDPPIRMRVTAVNVGSVSDMLTLVPVKKPKAK